MSGEEFESYEEFEEAAYRAAIDLAGYGRSQGYDTFVIGAAGLMLSNAAKKAAVINLICGDEAGKVIEAMRDVLVKEGMEDLLKEAEGVLEDADQ